MLVEDNFKMPRIVKARYDIVPFVKKYLPWEYDNWHGRTFEYTVLRIFPVEENGLAIIPLSFDEVDVVDTKKMNIGEMVFSDHIKYLYKENKDGLYHMYHTSDIPEIKKLK
jgi:hypothetical protein